jgi:hypothetical protein
VSRGVLSFQTVRTEGGLLPGDLLQRIALEDKALPGMSAEAYHLGEARVRDAVNAAWNQLTGAWRALQAALAKLPEGDAATVVTRDKWLLPLFSALGYGHLPKAAPVEVEGKAYPISHGWHHSPIHLVGFRVDVDARDKKVGASPHGLLQEFLNRSEAHLWGILSNGKVLRVLRDHHSLTRQAYLEFDLEAMFEDGAFSEFLLLWLTVHQSRLEAEKPEECWLEQWAKEAREEGVRALKQLREGVKAAISTLGTGFLQQKQKNRALHEALEAGVLDKQEYYRHLLRLVYRLIFLFVAEDRKVLLDPSAPEAARARYEQWYATRRLRDLAGKRRGGPHGDLWEGLRLLMAKLWDGAPELGLPALGSFLWKPSSIGMLAELSLGNEALLGALRALCYVERGNARHAVSFRNVGAEELGSVYESLLELHPEIHKEAGTFELGTAAGNERKTSGSYYTPVALVDCLLDSALDPVLDEAGKANDPEAAILALKVCDPACGSGHFLVAAARRMALRLSRVRSGGEEPSPKDVQRALRDVVGKCIFGVDLNPMAVELCKVSLWMEAVEPGKPLSFLEGHIQEGNALLGATPALLEKGIPDEAFEVIEGDDKKVASALRKQNKKERTGQTTLFGDLTGMPESTYVRLSRAAGAVEADKDDDIAGVRKKEADWEALVGSAEYGRETLLADAWCAAFVWPKQAGAMQEAAITQDRWLRMRKDVAAMPALTRKVVRELAREYGFFHWHLAFPQVFGLGGDKSKGPGWSGGFDVVLGNPPWERVKLQEQEFFATRSEAIAGAVNAAARKKLIAELPKKNPALWEEWRNSSRKAEGESHVIRQSGRYPLCGRGDVNTYAIFAEHNRNSLGQCGRAGFIIPTGIATDDTTKDFFADLMQRQQLAAFFGFENEAKLFENIDHRVNFCLMILSAAPVAHPLFSAFIRAPSALNDHSRVYSLSASDIATLNPNTKTCPVFRSRRDAEINLSMYRRTGIAWLESDEPAGNRWSLRFLRMFDMANDSALFRKHNERDPEISYVPLFEAKMIYHFNHRFGDFALLAPGDREHILPQTPDWKLTDAECRSTPRYWIARSEVDVRLRDVWRHNWLLGWRDVTDARSSARTVIASIIPRAAVSDTLLLAMPRVDTAQASCFYASICAFILDYAARQKIGGVHLKYHTFKQLPVLPPSTYAANTAWQSGTLLRNWLLSRVLELTYTAWDLEPFAKDVGYDGPPYRWDPERRFLLRCELDAAFFHLYGINRDDTAYIMDTFPIVRKNDEKAHGTYRTKDTILSIYDAMAQAAATAIPYVTRLDPPPADPRVAHPPRPSA